MAKNKFGPTSTICDPTLIHEVLIIQHNTTPGQWVKITGSGEQWVGQLVQVGEDKTSYFCLAYRCYVEGTPI